MEWTTETPTEAGWYWCKTNWEGIRFPHKNRMVELAEDGNHLMCVILSDDSYLPLEKFGRAKWYGPLSPPIGEQVNPYQSACEEWLNGCSNAEDGHPEQCQDCTTAFLDRIRQIGTT